MTTSNTREILCLLVVDHGTALSADPRRCEAFLHDHCGQNRREVNVLVAAAKARVGVDLLAAPASTPRAALLARLARRLADDHAIVEEAARWAVDTWAIALGLVQAADVAPVISVPVKLPPPDRDDANILKQPANVRVNPKDGATLLWVPPGESLVGDDDQKDNPRRRVYLDGFWIYKVPVTVAQFMAYCSAADQPAPNPPSWGWRSDHPVVNVTWNQAVAYAEWAAVSLPSESQWEKAARGADGRLYPWGGAWEAARCVHSVGSARTMTAPCEANAGGASPFGALDMAGNVWEWCADWYDEAYFRVAPARNPAGPQSGDRRALRGGSWSDNVPYIFRTSMRFRHDPGGRSISFGFRCAAQGAE